MQKNSVKNQHLDLVCKRVFISAINFVTGSPSVVLVSEFTSGTPNLVQLGSSKIAAMQLAATTDELDWLWVPADFDNTQKLYIRYLWTSAYPSANGTATFTTKYSSLDTGAAAAAPATALTVVHPASTKVSATAYALYWSQPGLIAPIATGSNAYNVFDPATIAVSFSVTASAVTGITIASNYVHIVGAELVYTPRITFGDNTRPARRLADGLQASLEMGSSIQV